MSPLMRLRRALRRDAVPSGPMRRRGRDVVAPDIPGVYEAFLGRSPTSRELAAAAGKDLHDVAAGVVATSEYRKAHRRGKVHALLCGTSTAVASHPVGTASPDDVAVVGRDGWLFIAHGANDFVRQVTGELPLSERSTTAWWELLATQRAAADRQGTRLAQLVIPDKLSIYRGLFPEQLEPIGPRPIEQILAGDAPGLLYPVEELRAAREQAEVYFMADSHTSPAGAEVLYHAVMHQLGREPVADALERPLVQGVMLGDLGVKFEPPLREIVDIPVQIPSVEMVRDNAQDILPLGGHLGVQRVVRNDAAPIEEKVVIFGDSYSYIDLKAPGNIGELLAATFREVHFLWAPFCWDESYVRDVSPDHVVMQMAERFAILTPRGDVDVRELAAETIRRKAGVPPDEVARVKPGD